MANKKLTKKQREVLERMDAGDFIWECAGQAIFYLQEVDVDVQIIRELEAKSAIGKHGPPPPALKGCSWALTPAGRDLLKKEGK